MINQHLADLINSGNAWAFVGSGVSVDAGLPDWKTLFILVSEELTGHAPSRIRISNLPNLFDKLIQNHGREAVCAQLKKHVNNVDQPGKLHDLIALWPFKNYVTTNYDPLLDKALGPYPGWVSIGNTAPEAKKISGEVSRTIWHPHGLIGFPEEKSRLIISQNDYDETYPAGSVILETLRMILRMRSLVFIGFGFNDPDLLLLLTNVARLSEPGRPAYAFLSDINAEEQDNFKVNYNVETIAYANPNGDHSELLALLRQYNSFIVGRNIEIGSRQTSTPRYDPEVTSLIVQNALCDGSVHTTREIQSQVVRASLVAALSEEGPMCEDELEQYARPMGSARQHNLFSTSLQRLIEDNLVLRTNGTVTLTAAAITLATERQGQAQLKFDQFYSSLQHRARSLQAEFPSASSARVSEVAADFFLSVCKDRGLAIAQNIAGGGEQHAQHRTVALIQELPKWFCQCETKTETRVLVNVVVGVLSEPRQPEKVYLGLLTQAYFGKHIAGYDEKSISIRRQMLSETTFVLDSHFIIVLLAKSSLGHGQAVELHKLLSFLNAPIVATDLIVVETAEHLEYAMKHFRTNNYKLLRKRAFDVVREGSGYNNSFITGYYESVSQGDRVSFSTYIMDIMRTSSSDILPVIMVRNAVQRLGICVDKPQEWPGFDASLWPDSVELEEQIKSRREDAGSYKHDRQVKAEAQVAGVVCAIREQRLQPPQATASNAFFVTNSPILDGLGGRPQRLSIRPGSLHQWLLSAMPFTDEMAANIFDHLLLELVDTGVQFVPRERIVRAFGEIVQANREIIRKVTLEHKTLVEEMYGSVSATAFSDIDDLFVPGAADHLQVTLLRKSRQRLDAEIARRLRAEKRIRELEKLQTTTTPRKRQKAMQQKRAAESKPRTKRQKQKNRRRKTNRLEQRRKYRGRNR